MAIASEPLAVTTKAPVALKSKENAFAFEAKKVFAWLDNDSDGFITDKEISNYLDVSTAEAKNLIVEAKIQLYGQAPKDNCNLTFDEFKAILESSAADEENISKVPERTLKRYRIVFDSMDLDKRGSITPAQLAKDLGAEALEELGLADASKITFDDFVKILRRAETGRATRMMTKLLEDKEQGQVLANVTNNRRASVIIDDEPSEEIDLLIQTIWNTTNPDGDQTAELSNVRSALLTASAHHDVAISNEDLMRIIFDLTAKASSRQRVTFSDFCKELRNFFDEDENPILERADSSSTLGWEAPSDTLSMEEFQMYRQIFDENDKDTDGFLTISELRDLTMKLVEKQFLQPDVRMFYFQVLKMLDEAGDEFIDFEQFVVLMQEASEVTASDLGDTEWQPSNAMSSFRQVQLKLSRHSKLRLKDE